MEKSLVRSQSAWRGVCDLTTFFYNFNSFELETGNFETEMIANNKFINSSGLISVNNCFRNIISILIISGGQGCTIR